MLNDSGRKTISKSLLWFGVLLAFLLIAGIIGAQSNPSAQVAPVVADQGTTTLVKSDSEVVEYTLRTKVGGEPAMSFVGVGGDIDGVVNPHLMAKSGDLVRITIVNGDPTLHDFNIDAFNVHSEQLTTAEQKTTVEFVAQQGGDYEYYCAVPGHRDIGMKGTLTVVGSTAGGSMAGMSGMTGAAATGSAVAAAVPTAAPADPKAVVISRNPTDVPPPVGNRGPQNIQLDLTTVEENGILADGTTFPYMTFEGKVPGPLLRVRVDDTVTIVLHNKAGNVMPHSIDLHAVTGPGGGATYTQVLPGESASFIFKALAPGLFVYHCATPSVPHHISSGMYGMILVEPAGGLPPVDHEFYFMEGEIYTAQPFGTPGQLSFDYQAMLDERPQYYVFNGAAGALTKDEFALHAKVGETVRIFFGVGGPNATSSFHIIGEIMDRVYSLGSLTTPPMTDVQTTIVPPGGATMVELKVEVPGRYVIVDHALSRMERGLAGYLIVDGPENPAVFHSDSPANSAGH